MRLDKVKTVFELSRNDIKARYSNSLLGIIWAFAMPLITILVFWYVFSLVLRISRWEMPHISYGFRQHMFHGYFLRMSLLRAATVW